MPPSVITMNLINQDIAIASDDSHVSATFGSEDDIFSPVKPTLKRVSSTLSTTTATTATTARSSISSTGSVEEITRKVKFSTVKMELLTSVPPASCLTPEEKSCLWWGGDELNQFENLAETQCRTMIQCRPSVTSMGTSSSYPAVLGRVYDACCNASVDQCAVELSQTIIDADFQQLVRLTRTPNSRRGLEGLAFKFMNYHQLNKNGAQLRGTVIHAVCRLQSNGSIESATKSRGIMHCSQRLTSASRLFAQILALADAEVVKDKKQSRDINPEKAKQRRSRAMQLMV